MKLPFKPHLLVLLCSTGLFAASGVMFVKSRATETPVSPAPVAQQPVIPTAQPAPVVAPTYTAAQIDQWTYGGVIILILIVHTSDKPTTFNWCGFGGKFRFDTRREKMT